MPVGMEPLKVEKPRQSYFDIVDTPILLGNDEQHAHVKELEKELSQVSLELANSIRRETELEDELERLRMELPNSSSDPEQRNSDYFSDSGASSTRFPIGAPDAKVERLEKTLRKVEQEKAQLKNEMASRLQVELSRRHDLEQMAQNLEERLQKQVDDDDMKEDLEDRVDELERILEDTKRLLNQERQAKGSVEDLYSATREQLEQSQNERDQLRDEVVPALKARLEGSRFGNRVGAIAEEAGSLGSMAPRSTSSLGKGSGKRGGSLTRSGSVKDREGRQRSGSSGAINVEGIKEIEDQRDALRKALQLLIIRNNLQRKEHERALKSLKKKRTMVENPTPKGSGYHTEVWLLKQEVTMLRKRTEDALEAKWQYEKGLSGIKMDLDRAEQETRGLRNLLTEHDIAPPSPNKLRFGQEGEQKLQNELTVGIASAEEQRDQARQAAVEYRRRAAAAQNGSAAALEESAARMDQLAEDLEMQLMMNSQLRERLTKAVARGEREQRETSGRIEEMQKRLSRMEDSVLAAQQHSENTLGTHEAEVRRLDEATSRSLRRLTANSGSADRLSSASPLPLKSPRLSGKRLADTSLMEMSQTQLLERKVRELESLLREAEQDVQHVVQRVNQSQLEVAELQTERDAATIQMRKLQNMVVEEQERAEQERHEREQADLERAAELERANEQAMAEGSGKL